MSETIESLTITQLKELISETVREALENYLEDLQALSSQNYINSIQEARQDYRSGKITALEDITDA